MRKKFDHEKLHAYQKAVEFCAWATPLLESLPTRLAARDQLDRASTSVVLNIAEGNGKRSFPDRSRFFDIARGSALECAACLDVLICRGQVDLARADEGKSLLLEAVSMVGGLIARFAGDGRLEEEQAGYGEDKDKDNE
ncbi:MAG: four helix bundle protein [Opitutaceae bacterium]|jgi:four helix bundle protein|nr:four helix bundle protein [Opitutaceae bacterium]